MPVPIWSFCSKHCLFIRNLLQIGNNLSNKIITTNVWTSVHASVSVCLSRKLWVPPSSPMSNRSVSLCPGVPVSSYLVPKRPDDLVAECFKLHTLSISTLTCRPNSTSVGWSRSWLCFPFFHKKEKEGRRRTHNNLTFLKFCGCPVGIWRVFECCWKYVLRVSGWCPEGVCMISRGCVDGIWRVYIEVLMVPS